MDEVEDNILHIQQTKRSSGAPSFIESKNTSSLLAGTQQLHARNHREKSETNQFEKNGNYVRTSSIRTQAPQVPANLASQSHQSQSRLASNDVDYSERQPNKKYMLPRPLRQYESLKNSQSQRSEMVTPEMRNKDGQN